MKLVLERVKQDRESLLDEQEIQILCYYGNIGKILNVMYVCKYV